MPKLPYGDSEFDFVTNVVSVDYLTKPRDVFSEMHRVLKPGGVAIMSFSNRCFFTKAISMWVRDMSDGPGHCQIVGNYFHFNPSGGWKDIQSVDISKGPRANPMWVVVAVKACNSRIILFGSAGNVAHDHNHMDLRLARAPKHPVPNYGKFRFGVLLQPARGTMTVKLSPGSGATTPVMCCCGIAQEEGILEDVDRLAGFNLVQILWVARECHAPAGVHPLAPGEELPGASMLLRRRLVDAVAKPSPFVKAMQPPGSIPLQLATGSLADGPPESLTAALKGTSLLRHTLSLRTKLLEAVGPELQRADDRQHLWELSVWAQSVIMSRAFKIPKGSDRLVLIPIVDIANHAATHRLANADVRNNADGSVSMVAVRDIAKREEVRICYGEYTNEQLLFCYGFVIPDNPCQGLVCPLQFPDSPKRSELLHHCLAHRRQLVPHTLPAKAGPLLYRASGTVPCELLLALKVANITETQAAELLEAKTCKPNLSEHVVADVLAGGKELGVIRAGSGTPGAGPMPRLFGGLATRAPRSQPGCRSGGLRALQATAGGVLAHNGEEAAASAAGDGAGRFTAAAAAVLELGHCHGFASAMAMQVVVSMETVGDDAAEPFFRGLFGELRRDWEGEIGIRFLAQSTFVITSLGRHLGNSDALEEDCSVTLWLSETESKLASVKVGPSSPVIQGYAYTEVFPRVVVHLGREYRLTQTCWRDMSDGWPDACGLPAADMVEQRFARFLGGAYDFHGGYPSFCDAEDGRRAGMLNFRAVPGIATLPTCPEMTVYELKQQLEAVTGVPPVQQMLSFGNRLMSKNGVTLEREGVANGDLLVLAVQVGSVLATGSKDGTARLWAVESGMCLRALAGHCHSVVSIEFAPSGSTVATASLDGTARIWSVETGSCLAELAGHADEVYSATFAPSGGQVLTASQDHTARVWSVDGTCAHVLDKHLGAVSAARFSPDGSRIVTASTDGTARVWEPVFGKCLLTLQGHGGSVSIAEISPDSTMLLTCALDTQGVLLRDASSGQVLRSLGDGLLVHTSDFSPDGSMIVAACCDWIARLWNCDDGRCLQNKIDRLDGFILIGRGLAKRLDLIREGGHFYAGAQCRAFFRVTDTFQWSCVKGMLMISKHFGDLDICVPMNTRKQVPKLGLDLCQRTDQLVGVIARSASSLETCLVDSPWRREHRDDGTAGSLPRVPVQNIDFKIAFEDEKSTEMEVLLQKGADVSPHDLRNGTRHVAQQAPAAVVTFLENGQSGSVFVYCGEDFTGLDFSLKPDQCVIVGDGKFVEGRIAAIWMVTLTLGVRSPDQCNAADLNRFLDMTQDNVDKLIFEELKTKALTGKSFVEFVELDNPPVRGIIANMSSRATARAQRPGREAMDTPKSYAARDYLQHCEHVLRVLGAPAGENLATVVAVLASMSFCCFSC
ncbi:unnamed protein product [Symbiodinium sp. KB8]|nr:unnamed protein product [Symbiodinium sp. KB8]